MPLTTHLTGDTPADYSQSYHSPLFARPRTCRCNPYRQLADRDQIPVALTDEICMVFYLLLKGYL